MRIKKLTFENTETGWKIENLEFGKLSLLVGASGVGKTQILKVIMGLKDIANGKSQSHYKWCVFFDERNNNYKWEGEYSGPQYDFKDYAVIDNTNIITETISKDNTIIVSRTKEGIVFDGQKTPKLDSSQSVIALLKEEELIKPIYQAWSNITIMEVKNDSQSPRLTEKNIETLKSLEAIRIINSPLIEKLFLLQTNKIDIFKEIEDTFKSIFPTVEKIDFVKKLNDNYIEPCLFITEIGVKKWISQPNISSGMLRTLMQITMIKLASDGDVILIDEFENSLGVNCIDDVADLVLHPDANVQFIITSHHPYIINNIPFKNWKIVTRNGSTVSVLRPEELNIGTHSKHEAFMQLIQTDAYKKGIL